MKKKIANLIDVKSIITIMFGAVFSGLAIVGRISEDSFMTVFVMIMTYYFAKNKSNKSENEVSEDEVISEDESVVENTSEQ